MLPDPTSLGSGSWDLTPTGFPHSDTYGSTLVWQLTALFRGLHRPSSPACPKASTSCPESLITVTLHPAKTPPFAQALRSALSGGSACASPSQLLENATSLRFFA